MSLNRDKMDGKYTFEDLNKEVVKTEVLTYFIDNCSKLNLIRNGQLKDFFGILFKNSIDNVQWLKVFQNLESRLFIAPEALIEFYKTLPADVFGGKSAEPREFLQKTFDNYLESDDWEKRDSALEIFDALHSFFKVPDYESVKELIIKDPSEFVRASGVKFLTTSYPILFNSDIWHLMTPELDSIVRRSFLHALENLETPSTIYLQNESTLICYLDDDDTFIHDKALSLLKRHCNFKSANPPNITTTDIFSLLTHQTESDETQVKECYGD